MGSTAAAAKAGGALPPAAEVEREADALLGSACPPDGPGAAVLVARSGEVLVRKGYGLAHLELGVPVRPEMGFRVGSLTKQFTAAAVLLLAQEGRLALEDDVRRALPGHPHPYRHVRYPGGDGRSAAPGPEGHAHATRRPRRGALRRPSSPTAMEAALTPYAHER